MIGRVHARTWMRARIRASEFAWTTTWASARGRCMRRAHALMLRGLSGRIGRVEWASGVADRSGDSMVLDIRDWSFVA